eukprot:414513-Pelagomonas_calceolata.AAC.6
MFHLLLNTRTFVAHIPCVRCKGTGQGSVFSDGVTLKIHSWKVFACQPRTSPSYRGEECEMKVLVAC